MSDAAASSSRQLRPADGSVAAALRAATARLRLAGCDNPGLDAQLLVAHVLGVDRARLLAGLVDPLDQSAAHALEPLVARREAREPLAYVLGRRGFRRLELEVDARVLVPRPDTETLVEAALELPQGARVVDIGTGSGAVALALADERPDLTVGATDVSADAIAVASANSQRLGLPVRFTVADLLPDGDQLPDAVVSNPPYVTDDELARLEPEIKRYEPAAALAGGRDGLAVIRRLVQRVAGVAFVALEVGAGQAPAVVELLVAAGYPQTETHRDLAGIERVVVGRAAAS